MKSERLAAPAVAEETALGSAQLLARPAVEIRAPRRRSWLRRLRRSPVGLLGAALVALVLFTALSAPLLAPYDPGRHNLRSRMLPPAWIAGGDAHFLLGTDQLGRDLLSRLIYGSKVSVIVGLAGVSISLLLGVTLGLTSGFFGGKVDVLVSRSLDTFMSIPFIILALAVVGIVGPTGGSSVLTIILVLGLTGWVTFARVIRGEVLSVKTREYVTAARSVGQTNARILLRHVLPNVTASIIVLGTLQVATVVLAEASLSFMGLGVQPPAVTWGLMLSEGRDYLATSWWLSTFPGIAISLTVLGVILLGDWLRDVLDPRLRT